jgi:hypothetical protein
MMRGIVELFAIPTMVRVVPLMVHAVKYTTIVPHMTFPQEKQPRVGDTEVGDTIE